MPQSQNKGNQKEQSLFAKRLTWALEVAGIPASPTTVQREYNFRSGQLPITSHAARKWLMGESIPTQGRIQVLANWLGVSASWLRFGEEIEMDGMKNISAQEWRLVHGFRLLDTKQKMHLLNLILVIPINGSRKRITNRKS